VAARHCRAADEIHRKRQSWPHSSGCGSPPFLGRQRIAVRVAVGRVGLLGRLGWSRGRPGWPSLAVSRGTPQPGGEVASRPAVRARKFPLGLNQRWAVLAFRLAPGLLAVATTLWYSGISTGPFSSAAKHEAIRTYSPYLLPLCCGFLVGVVQIAYAFQKTALLAVLIAGAVRIVHWAGGQWGSEVDGAQSSMMPSLPSMHPSADIDRLCDRQVRLRRSPGAQPSGRNRLRRR